MVIGEGITVSGGQTEGGSGYCKLPDGTLICYGVAGGYHDGTMNTITVTFPMEFIDANYAMVATGSFWSDAGSYRGVNCTVSGKTTTQAVIYQNNTTNRWTHKCEWIAIGRWK